MNFGKISGQALNVVIIILALVLVVMFSIDRDWLPAIVSGIIALLNGAALYLRLQNKDNKKKTI